MATIDRPHDPRHLRDRASGPAAASRWGRLHFAAAAAAAALAAAGACAAPPASETGRSSAAVEPVAVESIAHFAFDRDELRVDDRDGLLEGVVSLRDVTWQSVTAVGHADSTGDAAYNDALSRRRAEAVRAWLLAQGLDPSLIRVEAEGERRPVADNTTREGRARNRRAEVRFLGVRSTGR